MKTKRLLLCTLIAGILTIIFGGKAFATAGNTAEISGGKTWNICVDAGAGYAGSDFAVNIAKTGFTSQIVLSNGDCKSVEMAAGTYTASLNSTMGAGTASYETANDTLTFSVANSLRKYLNTFGSIAYTVEGSGEESPFELLFSMPGECQFNGNANVSGATCADGDGNPLTNKKYIDTGVALFSEENAGKDFEIYFTLSDYASTQEKQGTLFNAKYENSSMYYPGFVIRTVGTNGETMEITGRLGKDNTNADKANNSITTADIKNKEVKIVRVGGMVSYSIDGGEMIPFQNYKNFSRYFNQTAVFGASMQTNGNPQRYYDGTIKDIRVYLKKVTTAKIVFDANGGTGTMAAIKDIEVGTNVTLPANTFTYGDAVFTGWNTEADGSGTAYTDGATITISEAGKLMLYARWKGGRAVLAQGERVNEKLKTLADPSAARWSYSQIGDVKIKAIKNADSLPDGLDTTDAGHIISDVASVSPEPIYAWFDDGDYDNDGNGDGIIYIYTDASRIEGGESLAHMFFTLNSLSDISALSSWSTSNVTDMEGMFGNTKITNADALETKQHEGKDYVSWDVSNVTNMKSMFSYSYPLTDISALSSWNTSSVTNMWCMFTRTKITNADALETKQHEGKDYVSWDVSHVTDMGNMFNYDSSLVDISALSSWNTSSLTSMFDMFEHTNITNANALETKRHEGKDYVSWDVSNVTDMSGVFSGSTSLIDISALSSWDTSKVERMTFMFYDTSVADISALATWDTSSVTEIWYMFARTEITNVDALEKKRHEGKDYVSWNLSRVTDLRGMFNRASSLSDISALASWDVSGVTDMSDMFSGDTSLVEVSALASWNVSHVANMRSMFSDDTSLTDISALASWNVLGVTDMYSMFSNDTSLADVSVLEGWDTSAANTVYMFNGVSARPLPTWYIW